MCLNYHIDLSNMRLLASGTITYLVPRNLTSESFLNVVILIAILGYLETEIGFRLFMLFVECCLMHKKFQVNSTKIKGVKEIFVIFSVTTILVYR